MPPLVALDEAARRDLDVLFGDVERTLQARLARDSRDSSVEVRSQLSNVIAPG